MIYFIIIDDVFPVCSWLHRKFTNDNNYNDSAVEKQKIITKSFPFAVKSQPVVFDSSLMSIAMGLGMQFIVIPIVFATEFIYDREVRKVFLIYPIACE